MFSKQTNRVAGLAMAVSLSVGVCGCSSGNPHQSGRVSATATSSTESTDTVIFSAKARTQRTERAIADAIPGKSAVEQQPRGTLFTCADGRRQWAGGSVVPIDGALDMSVATESVAEAWWSRGGFDLARGRDLRGLATLDFSREDGEGYPLSQGATPNAVHIISSSRCFTVPEVVSGTGGCQVGC